LFHVAAPTHVLGMLVSALHRAVWPRRRWDLLWNAGVFLRAFGSSSESFDIQLKGLAVSERSLFEGSS
jgi:hypothetical protein